MGLKLYYTVKDKKLNKLGIKLRNKTSNFSINLPNTQNKK